MTRRAALAARCALEECPEHHQESCESHGPRERAHVRHADDIDRQVRQASPEVKLRPERGMGRVRLYEHDGEYGRGEEREGLEEVAARTVRTSGSARQRPGFLISVTEVPAQSALRVC